MASTTNRRPPNAGKGRKKGVPNKTTVEAKRALEMAFQGIGGVPALQAWANENRAEFYKLWGKLVPTQTNVTGSEGGPITVEVVYSHE